MPPEPLIANFPGSGPAAALLPPVEADTAPYYEALGRGALALQHCEACGRARCPVAPACPYCGAAEHSWAEIDGRGAVHSWVRYHRAFLPAFESLVPYVVVSVELEAGPRMFGRLASAADPWIGMPVQAIVERWEDGGCVPAFFADPDGGAA